MAASDWERQWQDIKLEESMYVTAHEEKKENPMNAGIEKIMPDNIQNTLDTAFNAAFRIVFEMGTPLIEHTYNKKKSKGVFFRNDYELEKKATKEAIDRFEKSAKKSNSINMAIAAVEGTSLGLFGVGVPDIPIFAGVLLRAVYQIAIQYGFDYTSEEEQIFILKVIENALLHGQELREKNDDFNRFIDDGKPFEISKDDQIRQTSKTLSRELLYMKFVQTLAVVGLLGGATDIYVMNCVTKYANIKYRRRFIRGKYQPDTDRTEKEQEKITAAKTASGQGEESGS